VFPSPADTAPSVSAGFGNINQLYPTASDKAPRTIGMVLPQMHTHCARLLGTQFVVRPGTRAAHSKCPADPHARRRPQPAAEGREPAAAWHGDYGAILAGAAVSPPGPQRITAHMIRACGIQTNLSRSQQYVLHAVLQYEYAKKASMADGLRNL
jgi:hypothetical protein